MRWYIVYTDEGPGGPCAQDCRTTSPWFDLYVVHGTYDDLRGHIADLRNSGRKNPRVVVFSNSTREYDASGYDMARQLFAAEGHAADTGKSN